MSEISAVSLKVRLDAALQDVVGVDSNDSEKQEMCMLLKANIDDMHNVLEASDTDQQSLSRILEIIIIIEVATKSLN